MDLLVNPLDPCKPTSYGVPLYLYFHVYAALAQLLSETTVEYIDIKPALSS